MTTSGRKRSAPSVACSSVSALSSSCAEVHVLDSWDDFPLLLAWLIPALILYGGGILAARAAEPKLWHSVWVVFGLVFVYGTLLQFLTLIDGDTGAPLNTVWTLCVVAAAGLAAAVVARVRFGWLVAGIALAIAWLALWDEILENGIGDDAGTFRGLCMVAALASRRARLDDREARARGLGGCRGRHRGRAHLRRRSRTGRPSGCPVALRARRRSVGDRGASTSGGVEPSLFWDLVLLGGSILLVAAGSLTKVRGPVYVGAIGILTFVVLVGVDLGRRHTRGQAHRMAAHPAARRGPRDSRELHGRAVLGEPLREQSGPGTVNRAQGFGDLQPNQGTWL